MMLGCSPWIRKGGLEERYLNHILSCAGGKSTAPPGEQTLTWALPPARPSENPALESRPSCHHPISKERDAGDSPLSPGSDVASEAGGSDGLTDRNQRTCSKSDEMLWFEGFIL